MLQPHVDRFLLFNPSKTMRLSRHCNEKNFSKCTACMWVQQHHLQGISDDVVARVSCIVDGRWKLPGPQVETFVSVKGVSCRVSIWKGLDLKFSDRCSLSLLRDSSTDEYVGSHHIIRYYASQKHETKYSS
jgi:hypothetical protein